MNNDAWVTVAVLAMMMAGLATGFIRAPWVAVTAALMGLVLTGVLEPGQAFAGIADDAVITIGALLILARSLQLAGGVNVLLSRLLGPGASERHVLGRLVVPVTFLSALINNTPIVATLAPTVRQWALDHKLSPSRFLIPVSFAAILGGAVTTIGTSTNLVVSGMVARQLPEGGPFGFFEVTRVGLPAAIIGGIVLVVLAPRLLPERTVEDEGISVPYEFHARVEPGGRVAGSSVSDAGLRNLSGVYLARLERSHTAIAPVSPDEVLREGDVLTFVGRVDQVRDVTAIPGLVSTEHEHTETLSTERYYEAVVGPSSRLVGHTLKDVGFRSDYGAVVLAIRRSGGRVEAKLGTVRLRSGDVLLLLSDRGFGARAATSHDFVLVSAAGDHRDVSRRAVVGSSVAMVVTVLLAATGIAPVVNSALIGVVIVAVSGAMTANDALDALDLEVLLLIGASLGLGAAVEQTGLAGQLSLALESVGGVLGALGSLAVLLVATALLTEILSNQATAAILAPVAITLAVANGADPRAYAVAVAVVASASFLTPLGYPTNTLVYGLGGYRYGDYWRLGLPLNLVVITTALVVTGAA